jgi:hypothetical protein
MLARLRKADEVSEDYERRSSSSTSSARRKNVQLRKLLDGIKEAEGMYVNQGPSPGRSDVTELTEKVQYRKGANVIDPSLNKIAP